MTFAGSTVFVAVVEILNRKKLSTASRAKIALKKVLFMTGLIRGIWKNIVTHISEGSKVREH
jgi:hypothetical protein